MSGKEHLTPQTKWKTQFYNLLKPKENICKTVKNFVHPSKYQ
jgi:hypothetical protein